MFGQEFFVTWRQGEISVAITRGMTAFLYRPKHWHFVLPAVLVLAALAVMRQWRYTTGSLLMATTILAILIGLVASSR